MVLGQSEASDEEDEDEEEEDHRASNLHSQLPVVEVPVTDTSMDVSKMFRHHQTLNKVTHPLLLKWSHEAFLHTDHCPCLYAKVKSNACLVI